MSLKLNSSGGGSVTLQEPNTASALTLDLPAVNGTVITTADSGTVSTAMLANSSVTRAKIGYAGAILQVVQAVKSDTAVINSASYVDVPGLSVSITPTASSSRFVVFVNLHATYQNIGAFAINRNGTLVGIGDAAGSRKQGTGGGFYIGGDPNTQGMFSNIFIDSPATASGLTYKVQVIGESAANPMIFNRSQNDANNSAGNRLISTITVMEVQG